MGRHVLHLQYHNQSPSDWDLLFSTHHVRLLPEGPAAHLAHEGLLPGVDLEVLLEVEPLGVDEKAAHRAALVVRPGERGE